MVGGTGITLRRPKTAAPRPRRRPRPAHPDLDDSLSAVDTQPRNASSAACAVSCKAATIFISHRTSNVRDADQMSF